MGAGLEIDDVGREQDTSVLWDALTRAKSDGDRRLVRAIEQRMRELAVEDRFSQLSDEQLRRRIAALSGRRATQDMIGHAAPESGASGGRSSAHIGALNRRIRENQKVGIESTLGALLDEWERRNRP